MDDRESLEVCGEGTYLFRRNGLPAQAGYLTIPTLWLYLIRADTPPRRLHPVSAWWQRWKGMTATAWTGPLLCVLSPAAGRDARVLYTSYTRSTSAGPRKTA